MRFFKFYFRKNILDLDFNENGYDFKFKKYSKFGLASLKTPAVKEVTYSKGPAVRNVKHNVFCVGAIQNNGCFCGISFFDLPIRLIIVLLICLGVGYASESATSGIIWSFLFYLLISFLSKSDDELLISLLERKFQ